MSVPNPNEKKLSLRVFIDPKRNKVVFAEADSDFVDILFSFMTLPLGTIVRLHDKHFGPQGNTMGSLNTLYDSLKKLNSTFFWSEEAKLMLLSPRNPLEAECQKLKLNIDDSDCIKYFICGDWNCINNYCNYFVVSTYNVSKCFNCGKLINREIIASHVQAAQTKGVFTIPSMTFLITDDLHVTTHLAGSTIELLNGLGIKRISALVACTYNFGQREIVNLIYRSIISKTPLSDVIIHNKVSASETVLPLLSQTSLEGNLRNMSLKVMVHKLTKKVLFAQATADFVDFLFSLLNIPLGNVVSLLYGNTSLGSILNLYKIIPSLYNEKYLKSEDVVSKLRSPKLPFNSLCKNQIFDVAVNPTPDLLCHCIMEPGKYNVSLSHRPPNYIQPIITTYKNFTRSVTLMDVRGGQQGFIRGPALFMVTDAMKVTPLTPISCMSFLDNLGISFCDVEEQGLNIGPKEALAILWSTLSTSSTLTNALIDPTLKKQMKQEK